MSLIIKIYTDEKLVLVLFVVAAAFSGCSSYNYYSVARKPLDPEKYKTFAWIPEGKSRSTSIYNNDIAQIKCRVSEPEMEKEVLIFKATILIYYCVIPLW